MGRLRSRALLLSERARLSVLELLAYAARVDGPLTPTEAAALDGAASGLGLPGRAPWPDALALDGARLLPPPLHELSALERRVAFGAAAWVTHLDGPISFVERAFLDFVAEEAGLGSGEVRALGAAAERTRRECGGRVPPALEFELLALEVLYLYALNAGKLAPTPLPPGLGPGPPEPPAERASAGGNPARGRRAS